MSNKGFMIDMPVEMYVPKVAAVVYVGVTMFGDILVSVVWLK